MARIRTLKPEFWTDEKLSGESPLTRLVFLGLISLADDAGRLVDGVKTLDGQLFPETDDTCREALTRLAEMGRILRYTTPSGQRLLQVVNWSRHQRIEHPSKYALPPPPMPVAVGAESLTTVSGNPHDSTYDLGPPTGDRGPATSDLGPGTSDQRTRMEGAGGKGETETQKPSLSEEIPKPKVTPMTSEKLCDTDAVLKWLERNAGELGIDATARTSQVGTLAVAERAIDRAAAGEGSAAGTFISLMKMLATDHDGTLFGIPTAEQRQRAERRLQDWHRSVAAAQTGRKKR